MAVNIVYHRAVFKSYHKTNTKVITLADHYGADNPVNQSEIEANTCTGAMRGKGACKKLVAIGFGFTSDWLTNPTTVLKCQHMLYICI